MKSAISICTGLTLLLWAIFSGPHDAFVLLPAQYEDFQTAELWRTVAAVIGALIVIGWLYPLFRTWVLWLRCIVVRGGHRYGRWWWPDRAEAAHCLCEECADMRTPQNRHSWLHRERDANAPATEAGQ